MKRVHLGSALLVASIFAASFAALAQARAEPPLRAEPRAESPLRAEPPLATWSARLEPGDARAGEGARIVVRARIAGSWHLYSTTQPAGGSPRTVIRLLPGSSLRQAGRVAQPAPQKKPNAALKITDELYSRAVAFGLPVLIGGGLQGKQRAFVLVSYALCSQRLCSPPATVRLAVSFAIAPGRARASRKRALSSVPPRLG